MIDARRVLAVVPARGGSKSVPLKNIHPLCGKPLIAHIADVVRNVPAIDRAVVSTDHQEIARVAQDAGLDVPFVRPPGISGDRIADWDVLDHALRTTEDLEGRRYDIVVMLQPTSPLRRASDVQGAIEMLVRDDVDAVWTVSETDTKYHPLKQLSVEEGRLDYYDPAGKNIIARQQLKRLFHRNGAAYAITRQCLFEQKTIKGERTGAFVVDRPMVSIDTYWDFRFVEYLMSEQARADVQQAS